MPKQRAERRYFMKKGDIYEGTVEKIEFPNKGILHIDGERVVVKNAIPGQKIQCVITKRRKGKSEARTLEILAHSPEMCIRDRSVSKCISDGDRRFADFQARGITQSGN